MKTPTVADVMTRDVTTLRADTPFKSVVWTLAARKISGAPVVDPDGVVMGVVSEADLLPNESRENHVRPWPLSSHGRRSRARKAKALCAGELMSAPAIMAGPETPLPQAAALLARHGVKRLPVVDTAGRLVGVVSRADVLRAFLRADDEIARDIEQHVIMGVMSIEPAAIRVRVCDGMVVLSGQLERKSMIALTGALARAVGGVVAVTNNLTYVVDDTKPEHHGTPYELWRR